MNKLLFGILLYLTVTVTGAYSDNIAKARAIMKDLNGKEIGSVMLNIIGDGVKLSVDVKGLSPGKHGFHIHSVGSCNNEFKAAGGHFSPYKHEHGLAYDKHHAGDMPNIVANNVGDANAEVVNKMISLNEKSKVSVFDQDGSSIIIHAKADTHGKDAGAGKRIACGIIEKY